jgi:hypothetical protein
MTTSEFRKLIREEVRKVISEKVTYSGDINNMDFRGPEKSTAMAYLKTPEGKNAVKIFKTLVSKEFDAFDLTNAIKAGKFKSMNNFRVAAAKGGLELEGLGSLTNTGNGDFAVYNDTYTDQGAAISFLRNKFYSVG